VIADLRLSIDEVRNCYAVSVIFGLGLTTEKLMADDLGIFL